MRSGSFAVIRWGDVGGAGSNPGGNFVQREIERGIAAVCALLFLSVSVAHAVQKSPWLSAREAKFAAWQAMPHSTTSSELWDFPAAPRVVVIRAGAFLMGGPRSEPGSLESERPQHRVRLLSFAAGKYEVTRGEFAFFVSQTGYDAKTGGCSGYTGRASFEMRPDFNWETPGFPQTDEHPVVCVSWTDAQAYVQWLRRETGKPYRLFSESEWEYAARGAAETEFWWGKDVDAACSFANTADISAKRIFPHWGVTNCDDRYVFTSPVGSFRANSAGLHDMGGNVWEWVADCWTRTYSQAPGDGAAQTRGNCNQHVMRGGAWNDRPRGLRLAYRTKSPVTARAAGIGFRVARDM